MNLLNTPSSVNVRQARSSTILIAAAWVVMTGLIMVFVQSGLVLGLLGIVGAAVIFLIFAGRPRVALIAWMASLTMLPIWIGIPALYSIEISTVVALIASAATLTSTPIKLSKVDIYLAFIFVASLLLVTVSTTSLVSFRQIVYRWFIPIVTVRILASAVGLKYVINTLAVFFGVVGGLATIELLLKWHPFQYWNFGLPLEYETWAGIQVRDGRDRSEWAFGHSIALGGALVAAVPFILYSSFGRRTKMMLIAMVCFGVWATGSRGAMIAGALTAALCAVYSLGSSVFMRSSAIAGALLCVMVAPRVASGNWGSLARGQSGEEANSYDYRGQLYSLYLDNVDWFGKSTTFLPSRKAYASIDSAFLYIGLRFGWVFLIIMAIPIIAMLFRLAVGRCTIAELALMGQIPLYFAVALITQYETVLFVVVGIAIQMMLTHYDSDSRTEVIDAEEPPDGPRSSRLLSLHNSSTSHLRPC
jgi:hypothetical protein